MNLKAQLKRPIQIIGTQRSGSNLLRLMLNQLDGVVAPHPPHILKIFMPLLGQYPDLNEERNFIVLIDDVCGLIETNPVHWENLVLDRNEVFDRCAKNSLLEIFRVVYELMAEANQSIFWCCKSMDNAHYVQEIELAGLKPYYIHLVRDGRDVASSFKKVAVGEKHIFQLATKWKEDQEISAQIVKTYGPDRAMAIRYEDLLMNPEDIMKSICSLIGQNYSAQVMDYFNSIEGKHTSEAGFMWHNLNQPILKENTGKFQQSLSRNEIEIFEYVAGNELTANNYELIFNENSIALDQEMISNFHIENDRLKKEIRTEKHLEIDIAKRKKQEELIDTIKNRLATQKSARITA